MLSEATIRARSEARREARAELRRVEAEAEPITKARLQELGLAAEVVGIDMQVIPPFPTDRLRISKVQFAPPLIFGPAAGDRTDDQAPHDGATPEGVARHFAEALRASVVDAGASATSVWGMVSVSTASYRQGARFKFRYDGVDYEVQILEDPAVTDEPYQER